MSGKKLWTEPKIKFGKTSYVWFRFYNEATGKKELIIRKGGANYSGVSKTDKRQILTALQKAILYKLKVQGWNPFTNSYPYSEDPKEISAEEMELEFLQEMTLHEILEWTYKKKLPDWGKKSQQDYKSTKKYLLEAAFELGIYHRKIIELRRSHYITLLEKVAAMRQLGAKGYNKYREHLSTFLSKAEEHEIIEYNPVEKIKTKEEVKTFAHRPPTEKERQVIVNAIKANHYNYFRFVATAYGTTLRPYEITGLQIKDVDFGRQCFIIRPEEKIFGEAAKDGKTKTKIYREVSIPNWLMNLLMEMKISKMDKEWYIFSKGDGGTFTPGPKRLSKNVSTTWWRNIVKNGLGLDVDQYGLKKLAGNDMVKLQLDEGIKNLLSLPQRQMGHTTSKMTETYVTEHTQIFNKIIQEKMPEL